MWKWKYLKFKFIVLTAKRMVKEYIASTLGEETKRTSEKEAI